jgi:hypothetical protein
LDSSKLQINLEQERSQIQKMNDFIQQSKQEWEEKIENFFISLDSNHLSHSQILKKDPDEILYIYQSLLEYDEEFQSFFDNFDFKPSY